MSCPGHVKRLLRGRWARAIVAALVPLSFVVGLALCGHFGSCRKRLSMGSAITIEYRRFQGYSQRWEHSIVVTTDPASVLPVRDIVYVREVYLISPEAASALLNSIRQAGLPRWRSDTYWPWYPDDLGKQTISVRARSLYREVTALDSRSRAHSYLERRLDQLGEAVVNAGRCGGKKIEYWDLYRALPDPRVKTRGDILAILMQPGIVQDYTDTPWRREVRMQILQDAEKEREGIQYYRGKTERMMSKDPSHRTGNGAGE